MDTIHRIDLDNLPDSSEPVARLSYAKQACKPTYPAAGPKYMSCMRKNGFCMGAILSRENRGRSQVAARS
jgi:hypothetical protein